MFVVEVTVHDHQELDCRTHTLTQRFNITGQVETLTPSQIKEHLVYCRDEVIRNHRNSYPRGRSYVIPIVEMSVTPNAEATDLIPVVNNVTNITSAA